MNRPSILCVDDEPEVLEGLKDLLSRRYRVHTAERGFEGLRILTEQPIEVVVSDMRMPVLDGARFLGMARERAPEVTRIVLTGQADTTSAIAAVNEGRIFRFLTKPVAREPLVEAIDAGIEQHRVAVAERTVLEDTVRAAAELLSTVIGAADPGAQGRAARVVALVQAAGAQLEVPDTWSLMTAASLSPLGFLALPADLVAHLQSERGVTPEDRQVVARSLAEAGRMVGRIPRLEGVIAALAPEGEPGLAARLLHAAVDLDLLLRDMAPDDALAILRAEARAGDDVLDALAAAAGAHATTGPGHGGPQEHALSAIPLGATFVQDVRLDGGTLLVARGVQVTPTMLPHLAQLAQRHPKLRAWVLEPRVASED